MHQAFFPTIMRIDLSSPSLRSKEWAVQTKLNSLSRSDFARSGLRATFGCPPGQNGDLVQTKFGVPSERILDLLSLADQESPLLNFRLSLILLMKEGGDCGLRDIMLFYRINHIVHTLVTV
jgi:hypothetical protein